MSKVKINQYELGVKKTSYLIDIDENKNPFYRVCIFFNHSVTGDEEMHLNKNDSAKMLIQENNEFFINTEDVDARIEQEKEILNQIQALEND